MSESEPTDETTRSQVPKQGSQPAPALGALPDEPQQRLLKRAGLNIMIGVVSGVLVVAFAGVIPLTNKIAVLEERITTLKDLHKNELERLEEDHEDDLRELSCQLYDQALEGFGEDCIVDGGQLSGTVCNYSKEVEGKRAKVFRPPMQGLGRLCAGQR